MESVERKLIIGFVTVGVNDGVQLDIGQDHPVELFAVAASGQDYQDLAATLNENENGYLVAGPTAPLALAMTAQVGLVGFGPCSFLKVGPHGRRRFASAVACSGGKRSCN
jgi:hypothetical protein